jgi:lipoate-protein ligase A
LDSYRRIHESVAGWLAQRGIAAEVAPVSAPEPSGACFVSHVRYDIVDGATKLAGAAQRRTRWGLLHQGSIQLPAASRIGFERSSGVDWISQSSRELAATLASGVKQADITVELLKTASAISQEKYGTSEWLRKF